MNCEDILEKMRKFQNFTIEILYNSEERQKKLNGNSQKNTVLF